MDIVEYKNALAVERARSKKRLAEIHKQFALDNALYLKDDILEDGDVRFRVKAIHHGVPLGKSDCEAKYSGYSVDDQNKQHLKSEEIVRYQSQIVRRIIE
jgi:hypothetical protein